MVFEAENSESSQFLVLLYFSCFWVSHFYLKCLCSPILNSVFCTLKSVFTGRSTSVFNQFALSHLLDIERSNNIKILQILQKLKSTAFWDLQRLISASYEAMCT